MSDTNFVKIKRKKKEIKKAKHKLTKKSCGWKAFKWSPWKDDPYVFRYEELKRAKKGLKKLRKS